MQEAQIQTPHTQKIYLEKTGERYKISDLFIYTSLICNKSCHHCFVSSTPVNRTLDELSLEDLRPVFSELSELGTQNIYFTGGEVFMNRDILAILEEALNYAPLTIYTNAAKPLEKKLADLERLNRLHSNLHKKNILLRVSLDHLDAPIHDIYYGRGEGAWQESLRLSSEAAKLGLDIAVTTQKDLHNRAPDSWVERGFVRLFQERGIELSDVKVLPDIPTGKHRSNAADYTPVSEAEFRYSGTSANRLMCGSGRTLLKIDGSLQVFPCTLLVPDAPESVRELMRYSMGTSLGESLPKAQALDHPACRAYCVSGRQSCAN